jgi:hypothetical protein
MIWVARDIASFHLKVYLRAFCGVAALTLAGQR